MFKRLHALLMPTMHAGQKIFRAVSRRADGTRYENGITIFPAQVTHGRPPVITLTEHADRLVARVVEIANEHEDPAIRAQAAAFRDRVQLVARAAVASAMSIEAHRLRIAMLNGRLPMAAEVIRGLNRVVPARVRPVDEQAEDLLKQIATFYDHADPLLKARAAKFKLKLKRAAHGAIHRATVAERERIRAALDAQGMPHAAVLAEEG